MQPLSRRVQLLRPSPTLGMTARARALAAAGHDVVSFAAGEPDFNTPEPIVDAAVDALRQGQTKYTASSGTPQLKEAIAQRMIRDHGIEFGAESIVASCGAKHSIYNALQVLVEPGDEVILLAPFWMTYEDQVVLAGGTPRIIPTRPEMDFNPDLEDLSKAFTNKTKAIILNSPSNPTGGVLSLQTLKAIAELAERYGTWIIADEIYDKLVYDSMARSVLSLGGGIADRTVYVNGCSKSFAMTGWRIGYAVAPKAVASAMSCLQDQVTSNPTSFAQAGAVRALAMPDTELLPMVGEFKARRDLMVGLLNEIPGFKVSVPKGAFYAFVNVEAALSERFPVDSELAEFLISSAYVATVPGSVFHGAGHLRLSYATSREAIEKGCTRIKEALSAITA